MWRMTEYKASVTVSVDEQQTSEHSFYVICGGNTTLQQDHRSCEKDGFAV